MLQLVLFNITNGLIIGSFYVLMALGVAMILNLSNVINFAHGNFLALGGYFAFILYRLLGRIGRGTPAGRRARLYYRANDGPPRL
jgi:branched-chain amino acid transport system permease protein